MVEDLAVAVLLAGPVVAGSAAAARVSVPLGVAGWVLVGVACAVVALRRRLPLVTLAVVTLCVSLYLIRGYAYGPVLIVFMLAVYSAARHAPARRVLWCLVPALALMLVHLVASDRPLTGWLGVVPVAAWVIVPGSVGYVVQVRRAAVQRERAELIRRRVDDERLRVAQEVHDIVGHGLAAIKMQADVALHVLARQPEQAETALRAISRTSGQALDELRATLAAVRREDPGRSPPAGLDGLGELRRRMADAGVQVRLRVDGAARPNIPAAVDHAGYRVVQESLTNVLRHGGCGQADVTVRYEPDSVAITVANPRTGGGASTDGSGIAGMRARVEALGGEFTAGPVAQRFEVHCRLPTGSPA
jgi:signal transduction histidine kinase